MLSKVIVVLSVLIEAIEAVIAPILNGKAASPVFIWEDEKYNASKLERKAPPSTLVTSLELVSWVIWISFMENPWSLVTLSILLDESTTVN